MEDKKDSINIDGKEYRFNITENIAKDIIKKHVNEVGKENFNVNTVKKMMSEYLGDPLSESLHFKFYKIPENDRLKYYQLLLKFCHFNLFEQRPLIDKAEGKEKENYSQIWEYMVEPIKEHGKVFEITDDLVPILMETSSEKTKFPFEHIVLDTRLEIYDRIYYGIMIGSFIVDDNEPSGIVEYDSDKIPNLKRYKGILSCYSEVVDGERQLFVDWFDLDNIVVHVKWNKYRKKLRNFIYSFCNFINEPEVKIIDVPHNPKNNVRREQKGAMPLPPNKVIRVYGNLKNYIEKFNSGIKSGYSHRFMVRGHYMHFRDQEKYSKLYSLKTKDLNSKGYQISDGLIKKWKKPFIKGHGMMVDKTYKVVGGKNE